MSKHKNMQDLTQTEHARLMDEEVSEKRSREMAEFEKELEGFQPPTQHKAFKVSYEKKEK